ncbi:hypothetical protein GCM10007916_09220 [Psychromonas marina]|uniref:HAMP domain-containing protein n=1 Tax=Psychromonas marina TaxID=88364 RepID=A0ABQ6DXZ0_9GAMM|nr:methyl-accepting chemotaxis protein [Psychromonas marina]GLS89855.1 hypothetical protein GCM10007916_09220 [Psychromonas marina]
MKLLHLFSIKQKLTIIFLFLLTAVSYLAISTIQNTQQHNKNIIQIDVVQQQRVVVKNYLSLFLLNSQQTIMSGEEADKSELKQSQFIFNKNSKALLTGGEAYRELETDNSINLDPIMDLEARDAIQISQKLWVELQIALQTLHTDSATIEQLSIVHHLADSLHKTLTEIINTLSKDSLHEAEKNRLILQISWFVIVLMGSIFSWLIAKNITNPLNNAAQAASRMRLGDLQSYPDQNNHRDELGTLIYEADEMRHTLGKLILEIQQHNKQIVYSSAHLSELFADMKKTHLLQHNQHEKLEMQSNRLQQKNHEYSQLLALHQQSNQLKKQFIDSATKSIQVAITDLKSTHNSHTVCIDNMNNLQKTAEQLYLLLSNLEQVTLETEGLASKNTTDMIKQMSPLLTLLKEQVNYLPIPLHQAEMQVTNLQLQLSSSTQLLASLNTTDSKIQETSIDLEAHNKQQGLQINILSKALDNALQLLKETNTKIVTNQLFAQDLHTTAMQLDKLTADFKTDKKVKRARRGNDKRLHPRINNQLEISLQQQDKVLHGLTQDISLSGLQMKSLQPIQFDHTEPVNFSIILPNNSIQMEYITITLLADIVHYKQQQHNFLYRLSFHSLDLKDQAKIQQIFDYFDKSSEFKMK